MEPNNHSQDSEEGRGVIDLAREGRIRRLVGMIRDIVEGNPRLRRRMNRYLKNGGKDAREDDRF